MEYNRLFVVIIFGHFPDGKRVRIITAAAAATTILIRFFWCIFNAIVHAFGSVRFARTGGGNFRCCMWSARIFRFGHDFNEICTITTAASPTDAAAARHIICMMRISPLDWWRNISASLHCCSSIHICFGRLLMRTTAAFVIATVFDGDLRRR